MQDLARSIAAARGELKRARADLTKFKSEERYRMNKVEQIINTKQITIEQIDQIKKGNFTPDEPAAKKQIQLEKSNRHT